MAYLNRTTKQWQEIDTKHHLHPFTDYKSLAEEGSIIVTKADGVHLTTSDDKQLLDAMSGLWCVNVGYGRKNLAEVAYKQMQELPYYNSFFKTATPPSIELARELAELSPHDLNHAFFSSSGSEANDTVVRMVRRYWDLKGKPNKKTFISREFAYHGSTMTGMSLGGMTAMHSQGDMMPGFEHVLPPYWYKYGNEMSQNDFGIFAAYLINSEKYIGWFQFEKDKEFEDSIEIGWRLKKQYWGNGYATEVATVLCELGIKMGKTIVARAMVENLASIRVMEKAGLKFEKKFWYPHSSSPDVLYKR